MGKPHRSHIDPFKEPLSQRVHIYYHYGIRSQKTIPIMVFGAEFHNSSVYGPSWFKGTLN